MEPYWKNHERLLTLIQQGCWTDVPEAMRCFCDPLFMQGSLQHTPLQNSLEKPCFPLQSAERPIFWSCNPGRHWKSCRSTWSSGAVRH